MEEAARRVGEAGYAAILEVCGFHDWLTELLPACGCREVVLIQPDKRSRRKTDRRDAHALREILWLNREALLSGRKVKGERRGPPLLASVPGAHTPNYLDEFGTGDKFWQPKSYVFHVYSENKSCVKSWTTCT